MANTTKTLSSLDHPQVVQAAFNPEDSSLATNGFLVGKVGRKIALTISTTTITNDTETYAFTESTVPLYTLKVIYTDGARTTLLSAERTA